MAKSTIMLEVCEFRGATILTAVGGDLSGTDQRRLLFSAEAKFFNHPNVGVSRSYRKDPLAKALAVEHEYLCVDSGSAGMLIRFTYTGMRNDARQRIRRKASAAKRRGAPEAVEAARGGRCRGRGVARRGGQGRARSE